jgi:hypothetical protein
MGSGSGTRDDWWLPRKVVEDLGFHEHFDPDNLTDFGLINRDEHRINEFTDYLLCNYASLDEQERHWFLLEMSELVFWSLAVYIDEVENPLPDQFPRVSEIWPLIEGTLAGDMIQGFAGDSAAWCHRRALQLMMGQ